MNDNENPGTFWIGNAVLVVALIMLLYMNTLWEVMGPAAMLLWICVVGVGAYLLMNKKNDPPFS